MALQDIGLNAVFRDKEFQHGINNYQKEVDSAERSTEKASSRMSSLGDVAGTAAVVGIGAATAGVALLVAGAKVGIDALNSWNDQVNTLSDNLGTTGEQSAVWAAAFNHVGLTVDEGGAGLNFFTRGLADLRDAMNEGKDLTPFGKALDKLGVSAFDADGKLRTFDQVMPDLMNRFQEMPAGIDKTALAMELFGSRAGTKFIDFLSQGSAGLEHAKQMVADFGLGLTTEGSGAIEEFGFAWNDLQLGFQGVMAQIGLAVMPVLQTLIGFLTSEALPVLSKLGRQVMPVIIDVFNAVVAAVAPFIPPLIELGKELVELITTGKTFDETFGQAVAGAFGPQATGLLENFGNVVLTIREVFGAVWAFIQPVLQNIFNELAKFWTEIQPRLQKAWDNIYKNIIVPVLTAIAQFITAHGREIRQIFEGIWQIVSGIFQTAWALISGIVKIALDLLGGDMETAGRDWEELVRGVWEGVQNIFMGAWAAIGQFVVAALIALNQAIADKMEEARQGIIDKLNQAIDWLRNLPGQMAQLGIDIIQGLIDGFFQQAGAVQAALSDIIQSAVNNILNSLGLGGLGGGFVAGGLGGGGGRSYAANVGVGMGLGNTTSSKVVNVSFYGQGGPANRADAQIVGSSIADAMNARGIQL